MVHVVGRQQAEAAVMMFGVVPREEALAVDAGVLERAEAVWEGWRYFNVLKWASEYGLSFDTWGRECVLVTPRSASRNATDFEVIAWPRSA
jgi:hypothetical protein